MSSDLLRPASDVLSLSSIRSTLIRLEETIIFCSRFRLTFTPRLKPGHQH
jgi:hypothetical protein